MKKILITESERDSILSMYKNIDITTKINLSEQIVTNYDKKYDYRKEGDNYYYSLKGQNKWISPTGKGLNAIKTKVFKQRKNSTSNDLVKKDVILKKKKNTTGNNIQISPTINPEIKNDINWNNLSAKDTTKNICHRDDIDCAQFVNDFSDKFETIGNAWDAYANDTLVGPTVYSAFKNLDKTEQDYMIKTWLELNKSGGGKENGSLMGEIKAFVDTLVPKLGQGFNNLKLDDVVGIYYPPSYHHEEAFYQGGRRWFKDVNGKKVVGETIKKGNGWGMNTHVGIVGAIKDGIPLIFHNISKKGYVQSDPPDKLRIAWVKRK